MTHEEIAYFNLKKKYDSKLTEIKNLKQKLKELEPKSCEGCIHHRAYNGNFALSCCECSRFYSDNFEEAYKIVAILKG